MNSRERSRLLLFLASRSAYGPLCSSGLSTGNSVSAMIAEPFRCGMDAVFLDGSGHVHEVHVEHRHKRNVVPHGKIAKHLIGTYKDSWPLQAGTPALRTFRRADPVTMTPPSRRPPHCPHPVASNTGYGQAGQDGKASSRAEGPVRVSPGPPRRDPCPAAGPGTWDGAAARQPSIR